MILKKKKKDGLSKDPTKQFFGVSDNIRSETSFRHPKRTKGIYKISCPVPARMLQVIIEQ